MDIILKQQPMLLHRNGPKPGIVGYQRAAVTHRTLDDARVYGPGVVLSGNELHFGGLTYSNQQSFLDARGEFQFPMPDTYVDRELTLLWGYFAWDTSIPCNWSHFIWTYLMRLAFAEPTPLLVSERVPERFLDWARALGFTDFEKVTDGVRVRRLHIPSVLCYRDANGTPAVLPSAVYMLRNRLGIGLPPVARTRVYIERGQSSPWRRVLNEAELMAALTAQGFQCISPERMTVDEQLDAMGAAEVIVNPFGGASAMNMFAPEDCKVIELSFPPVVGSFAGSMWADVLGQQYVRVDGVPGEQTGPLPIDRDFTVPVAEVVAAL